jgi:hypothetical protein
MQERPMPGKITSSISLMTAAAVLLGVAAPNPLTVPRVQAQDWGGSSGYGDRIRCESRNFREQFCPADTRGGVRLVDRHSNASCRQGESWTWDSRGIYVREGCAATFQTSSGYGGGNGNWSGSRDRDRDGGGNTGAVIAAVAIGAGLLWAISNASKNKDKKDQEQRSSSPAPSSGSWRNPDAAATSGTVLYERLSTVEKRAVDSCMDATRRDATANGASRVDMAAITSLTRVRDAIYDVRLEMRAQFKDELRGRTVDCRVDNGTVARYQLT